MSTFEISVIYDDSNSNSRKRTCTCFDKNNALIYGKKCANCIDVIQVDVMDTFTGEVYYTYHIGIGEWESA